MLSKRLDIQGIRAVAVLSVVLFHAGFPLSGGFVGVDMFFVVSGYIITLILHHEFQQNGQIQLRKFYIRRFRRLFPALSLVVFTTLSLSLFLQSPLGSQQITAETAIAAIFLSANLMIANTYGSYFSAPAESNPLLHTWSLSIEEQFYLFFPVLMSCCWILARKKRFSNAPLIGICIVAFGSFSLAILGSYGISFFNIDHLLGFYSPVTRAWEFAVGSFLVVLRSKRPTYATTLIASNIMGAVGGTLLFISFFLFDEGTIFPGLSTLMPVIGTALLIQAGTENGVVTRLLKSKLMVKIGDWSYSIYLWHWPLISLTNSIFPDESTLTTLVALVSCLPAILSFYYVENPIRKKALNTYGLTLQLAVFTFFPVLILAAVLYYFSEFQLKPKYQSQLQTKQIVYELGCHWNGGSDLTPCSWNKDSSKTPIYLLGDSNAAHFVEGLILASTELEMPFFSNTSSSCPFLFLEIKTKSNPGYARNCVSRNVRLLTWIKDQLPGVVILSMSDEYFLNQKYEIKSNSGWHTSKISEKTQLMGQDLLEITRMLKNLGHRVIIIQTVPHFTNRYAWKPTECLGFPLWSAACKGEMPSSYSLERSKEIIFKIQHVASLIGVEYINFAPIVCPNETCTVSSFIGSGYQDSNHISVAMDKSLWPTWKLILSQQN